MLHDPLDRCVEVAPVPIAGGADLPFGLGTQMPHLPGRPGGLHDVHHRRRGALDELSVTSTAGARCPRGDGGEHPRDRAGTAEHADGLLAPGGALLGERAGFVLGGAGFQGGALGQRDGLDRGRRAAVVGLELRRPVRRGGRRSRPGGRTRTRSAPGSTPTISRTGRLPLSGPGRAVKRPRAGRPVRLPGGCCSARRR